MSQELRGSGPDGTPVGDVRRYRLISAGLAAAVCLISAACVGKSGRSDLYRDSRAMMGTIVEIAIGGQDRSSAKESVSRAFDAMSAVERELSRTNPHGALARLNSAGRGHEAELGEGLLAVLRKARSVAGESAGAFDPTLGALVGLWDFDGGGVVPEDLEINNALKQVGWWKIQQSDSAGEVVIELNGVSLELGGIAKGYAVDEAVASLLRDGVSSGIVDAGGDLRLIGVRPGGGDWRIGVQDPRDRSILIARLFLKGQAVATSGDYERAFTSEGESYHHILDPATGKPARRSRSVTVVAPTAMEADAFATAVFVLGPERGIDFLRARPGVHGMIVDASGGIHWTDSGAWRGE